jgi:putative effector of murein hydrolase LrgA (UPF0299 family)
MKATDRLIQHDIFWLEQEMKIRLAIFAFLLLPIVVHVINEVGGSPGYKVR